ncbi:hypothetical protein Tco_0937230 [Tanacetum coccineum]|uniref:Gag-Pol polyprotein n=1 Tax=Tanacetum coccineum TaxID=301880 RepID=A0ABQ5DDP8_9ASTR
MSNSNTNLQTQSSNALHNAIMEAGSKDRPPMLAPGNYVQWKSRIKRYIDTKPNRELIHYSLQNPPYIYQWAEKTVPVAEGSSETTIERYMENYKNVSQDIRDQMNAEAEAVQIILTGIDNDIYSTVDACPNACEMWKAIERLKQGESINVQDLETNLYWEFGKFTSRDGESLESYYSRFYKMMNELVRNQCNVTNHQVNVQFLLQLQPEWQRFVTLVKQSQELKTVSYHKLYDILKQHQNEVNEIRTERLARTANPLALVAQQQPVYHPPNHPTQNTQYSSTRSQQSTRNRGKAIVTSSAPTYDPEPATVTEDDEMSKEKEIDKLMALISLSFKKNILESRFNTSKNTLAPTTWTDLTLQDATAVRKIQMLMMQISNPYMTKSQWLSLASSMIVTKNMPRFSSNDMVHNHYLDEARKKTQERDRNSKTSMMPSARFQSTADGSKPKPRSNNQTSRSLPVSKNLVLRWKPTGKIFRTVGLRWVPTGKIFTPSTTKVDSEPPNGSNADITNQYESTQTPLKSSAVSTEVHQAAETVTTSNELNLLFGPLFDEYFNGENQVVLKSSAVTTTDASNKRQQPDSTSSTSTLATTVTANGNFDL